ncbi:MULTISPECIES: DUF4232 domain-containing protein [unclassified Streptomyces]|uniref:DUF4232 domain-containing protein n=1 Tax=unclassified Streptomyces TaxID=2593676 RepID=UPI0036D12944
MSARTRRSRLMFASALAAVALSLTACDDGQDVRDEGASSRTASTATPTAAATSSSGASEGTTDGTADGSAGGAADSSGATGSGGSSGSKGSSGSAGSAGSTGAGGSKGSAGAGGSSGAKGSSGSTGSGSTPARCSVTSTRTTATQVSRPLNHLLLTVTNTGSKNCDLLYYPAVRFGEAQSVPPVFEDSKPQAVVTLAPGESGYAGVLLSAGDGSGSHGYTAKSLEVYFDTGATAAAHPSLPAKGVYVDDSVQVTYWQSTMADALDR